MLNLPIIELHRIVSYIQQTSTSTSVIGRTIKIWFRLPQPIMRHAIMTDFPEVNALIITVWRYSPSQNIQAKLQTIAYCVMTWRNWHQSCGIEHSPSNKLNPYIYKNKLLLLSRAISLGSWIQAQQEINLEEIKTFI